VGNYDDREKELGERFEKVMASVSDPTNCILNFRVPSLNCALDTVAKLDDSVYPPKAFKVGGQAELIGAGSESVHTAIKTYQPLLDLCGHVHESRGTTKIGRTLVINPGSEYSEGILRGVIVNIADKKVLSWQLTSG
jgi:Icc-related predicted phosphoesterase